MNTKIAGALALVLFGVAATANAATDTKSFNVTLTITSTCDIHTGAATDVAFGSVASTAVNTDASGNLIVNCTPNTAYSIGLGFGLNGSDVNTRAMKTGSVAVPYQLYKASGRTAADIWGTTTGGSGNVLSGTGTGGNQNVPVYGRVPSANFAAGTYSDTVVATVTY